MAGTPTYASVSISGYNASPPADDGTLVAANLVKYSHPKEKLADPLKTALESINTNVDSAIDAIRQLFSIQTVKSSAFDIGTTITADDGRLYLVSGNTTATLPPPATAGAGFRVGFKKNDAAGTTVTINPDAAETIDGASSLTLATRYDTVLLICDGTNWHVVDLGRMASL